MGHLWGRLYYHTPSKMSLLLRFDLEFKRAPLLKNPENAIILRILKIKMATKTEIKKQLLSSDFLNLRLPPLKVEAMVEKILKLPEEKQKEALAVIMNGNQAVSDFANKQEKNAQSFIKKLINFKDKTVKKHKTAGKKLKQSTSLLDSLKSKIKN